jgi:hypothetical protein
MSPIEYSHTEHFSLTFFMFVVSVLVLEGILSRDEAAQKQAKRFHSTQARLPEAPSAPDPSSVLILAKAVEEHSRESKKASQTPEKNSSDSVTPASQIR